MRRGRNPFSAGDCLDPKLSSDLKSGWQKTDRPMAIIILSVSHLLGVQGLENGLDSGSVAEDSRRRRRPSFIDIPER
jgi:hypothetical protein